MHLQSLTNIAGNDLHYAVYMRMENVAISMHEQFQWKQYVNSCYSVLRKNN